VRERTKINFLKNSAPQTLTALVAFSFVQSCSTAENGRCKKFSEPKYVASFSDTDGKPWEMRISPEVADLKCDYNTGDVPPTGELIFSVVVLDGQGQTKPALAVSPSFVGSSASPTDPNATVAAGFYVDPYLNSDQSKVDDKATDSCGVAVFRVKWVCPAAKKTIGGSFSVTSGPLFSKAVKVTLEHPVQQDVVVGGANPNP
jgi:hypothetical protein